MLMIFFAEQFRADVDTVNEEVHYLPETTYSEPVSSGLVDSVVEEEEDRNGMGRRWNRRFVCSMGMSGLRGDWGRCERGVDGGGVVNSVLGYVSGAEHR